MKVYVASLGCKLNQSEIERFARELSAAGHQVVNDPSDSDTIILNTCTVTQIAARKSCQLARRLHRANANAQLVLTGCFAETSPDKAAELPGVQRVIGNTEKDRLLELLGLSTVRAKPVGQVSIPAASQFDLSDMETRPTFLRTRALVKIQDGCDNQCTYCVVRIARGLQRSRDKHEIIAEIHNRVRAGYKEIVLTGVHIGAYGRDQNQAAKTDLWDLVSAILRETTVPRLRLSSIEPWDISLQHLALWQNDRLCRHLHFPLQSGSDTVLSRMKRRYTTREFADVVESARRMVPQIAITTDLIVGFPGETEHEFEETLRFVTEMQFSRAHIFPYSARAGTQAADFPDQMSSEVKQNRARRLLEIARQGEQAFWRQFVGRTETVLWETRRAQVRPGCHSERSEESQEWSGLTDHYVRVTAQSPSELRNQIIPARITGLAPGGLRGEVLTLPDRFELGVEKTNVP